MKKLLLTTAFALAFASNAFAENFSDHSLNINMTSGDTTLSAGTGANYDFADSANVYGIKHDFGMAYGQIELIDGDNSVDDYRFTVGKLFTTASVDEVTGEPDRVTFYAAPELHYTVGDSFAKDELRISPSVGVAFDTGLVTPYAELGYDWKSSEGDLFDFSRADAYAELGVAMPVSDKASVQVAIMQDLDSDLESVDREVALTFNVSF
jgi:opacity protein-like surface antigen